MCQFRPEIITTTTCHQLQGWWRLRDPNFAWFIFHQEEIINHKHQKQCSNAEIRQYLHLKRFDGANSPLHHLHLPRLSTENLQDLSFSVINLSEISLITEQGLVVWGVGMSSAHLSELHAHGFGNKPSCRYCRLPEL